MNELIDLTLAGCVCPHDVTIHRREMFTNKATGEGVPAIVCTDARCFCWRRTDD